MSKANATDKAGSTHRRLLDVAVALFAEHGFRKTTVRAICEAADANVSAVKYHFGNKAALYDAAFDHARLRSNETNPFVQMDEARDFHADQTPERRLYLFIRTLLEHQFRDGQPTDLTKLMSHEMVQPTPALDRLIEVSVKRVYAGLIRIILDLMPTPPRKFRPRPRKSRPRPRKYLSRRFKHARSPRTTSPPIRHERQRPVSLPPPRPADDPTPRT